MKKISELKDIDASLLVREMNELLKAQFGLRMQLATQQSNNTSELKKIRRGIARVKTVINQKGNR